MSHVFNPPAKKSPSPSRPALGSQGLPNKIWDAVFIGSGTGSLAAAAALAKLGKSVLVLEAHTQLGGLTHSFARRKVRWSAGLHYTGWPTAYANDFPELWEILTQGQAPWVRLPEEGDCYIHSEGRFVKRGFREDYKQDLLNLFPNERNAIERYFHDMQELLRLYLRFMPLQSLPPVVERLGLGWWLSRRFLPFDRMSVVQYMDQLGASEKLREHLWFTWGNFGGVPQETSVGAYAVPMEFLMDGLWTMAGGSQTVAEVFSRVITAAGGELRRGVAGVGAALSRQARGGSPNRRRGNSGQMRDQRHRARETFDRLVPVDRRPPQAQRIAALPSSCSIMTLYMALKPEAITRFGLNCVNYWVESEPHGMRTYWTDLDRPPKWFVLSLASQYQQEAAADALIAAEVFVGIPGQAFQQWKDTQVMHRGPEYDQLKQNLAEKILARLRLRPMDDLFELEMQAPIPSTRA